MFRLNRSQVARIQSRWSQGSWSLLFFSSANLKDADIILEFSQPKSIPDKVKSIFGPALISEKQSVSTGLLSVRPKTPGSVVSKARLNASDGPGMKSSATKGFLAKTRKTDSRTSFQALSSSQDQSSLPCAQPPPVNVKKPSSSIPQKLINQVKKVSKMSMSGSLKLAKKPKSTNSIRTKSPKMKTPEPNATRTKPSPKKNPKPFENTVAKKTLTSSIHVNEDDDSLGAIIKSQESSQRVTMKRKSKSMANSKIADIKDIESKGSDESLLKDATKVVAVETESDKVDEPRVLLQTIEAEPIIGENVNVPPVDHEVVMAGIIPETETDASNFDAKTNRLSYSGRRIRAQRKAIKRKSENPDIPIVKKKICFDGADGGKIFQEKDSEGKEPKSHNVGEIASPREDKTPVPGKPKQAAKSLLSDWDEIFNEPLLQDKDLSESIPVGADKEVDGKCKIVEDVAPEATKSQAGEAANVVLSQQNNPEPIVDNIPAPAKPVEDDDKSKRKSILINGCGNGVGGELSKKKKRSSKVLFSETVLDSEADQVSVDDNNELRPEVIPTYDQTYRRVESKPNSKSGPTSKTPQVNPMDCSSTLNSSKKFFKEKVDETHYEFSKPSISKPKRTYQRRPSGSTQSVTNSTGDPYSFSSNPQPKGNRRSYLPQRRRATAPSKRRSDKLFSDDEGGDSVKGSPEKSFVDSGLRISDVGDMGDTGCEEVTNSTLNEERKLSKYASRRKSTNKEISKQTLLMLDHMSGMLKAVANMSEGTSKKVLSDISFFIMQQSNILVLE